MVQPDAIVTIIPARMASSRLPGKPLADIAGEPMIVRVWRQAMAADLGPVVVACADADIADAVAARGGRTVITRADHPSGSDRVFEALEAVDPKGRAAMVINLQGDLPTIAPAMIRAVARPLEDPAVDIATLVTPITDHHERSDPNVVKAVLSIEAGAGVGRALYFSRATVPAGDGPLFHHIGIYAYRPNALARFVKLPPSPLERRERLEQLRALEAGMVIAAAIVDTVPLGVDTSQDLERARQVLRSRSDRSEEPRHDR